MLHLKIPILCLHDAPSSGAFQLAIAILSALRGESHGPIPVSQLAQLCNWSERTVQRHLATLEEAGWIAVARPPGEPCHITLSGVLSEVKETNLSPSTEGVTDGVTPNTNFNPELFEARLTALEAEVASFRTPSVAHHTVTPPQTKLAVTSDTFSVTSPLLEAQPSEGSHLSSKTKHHDNEGAHLFRAWIDTQGVSHTKLAEQLGFSRQAVNRWASSERIPRPEQAYKLADITGIEPTAWTRPHNKS